MKKKNIVITGANRGLGLYLAKEFLIEGHNLVLLSRTNNFKKQFTKTTFKDQKIIFAKLDLEKKNDINKVKNLVKKRLKKVDLLINNAAIQGPIGIFHKNNFLQWEKTITINLVNTALMIKNFIPLLKNNKSSCVINISGGGSATSRKFFSSYSVAKTGLVRLTENLAEEYEQEKIKFYAIAPGVLNTRMFLKSKNIEKNINPTKKKVVFSEMKNTLELIKFLSNNNIKKSGKLISAIWDKWKNKRFIKLVNNNKDLLTLRRIIK